MAFLKIMLYLQGVVLGSPPPRGSPSAQRGSKPLARGTQQIWSECLDEAVEQGTTRWQDIAAERGRAEREEHRVSDGQVVGATVGTPWGSASELKKRKLHPGSGTPRAEVIRNQREALLHIMDDLCAELGYAGAEADFPRSGSALGGGDMLSLANPQDELLVAKVRRGLEKVATAVGRSRPEVVPRRAVHAALDGAELVMRGELATGSAAQLPALIPSFVFLVTLPIVKQDRALCLSRRTSELINAALQT